MSSCGRWWHLNHLHSKHVLSIYPENHLRRIKIVMCTIQVHGGDETFEVIYLRALLTYLPLQLYVEFSTMYANRILACSHQNGSIKKQV